MDARTGPWRVVVCLACSLALGFGSTGFAGAEPEVGIRVDVLECNEGETAVPCGTGGEESEGVVPWQVDVSPCGDPLDLVLGVVIESKLEPCFSTPSACDKSENFKDGDTTFGCTDGIDNDNDGLMDLADPDCIGAKAWSFSLAIDECFAIQSASDAGTAAANTFGGGIRSASSFIKTEVVDPAKPANGGQRGVVNATVLAFAEPIILDQVGDHLVLRIRGLLDTQSGGLCGFRFNDPPLAGGGDPVRTVVTVGGESANSDPAEDQLFLQLRNTTVEAVASGGGEDCNTNGVADLCEIADGSVPDCDGDGVPDSCDLAAGAADCDGNGVPDSCDLTSGGADCDANGIPDSCDIASGATDCDTNGIPDSCDITAGAADCDGNGVPDSCDLASGGADCDANGIPDSCDIASGAPDCDTNGVPDSCDLSAGAADCNANGVPDSCDIAARTSQDVNPEDSVPDECGAVGGFVRGDCDGDGSACTGVGDALTLLTWFFSGGDEPACLAACDVNGDGEVEGVSDAITDLNFCFQGSEPPPAPHPDCGPGTAADEVIGCLQFPEVCQ